MLVAACVLAWSADGRAQALARVRASGVLRWGADVQGGEPYVSQKPDGTLVGFEADLASALATELGVTAQRVQNDWSTLLPALERDTFDVVLNGFEVTAARAARVSFSRPYYTFTERLVARRGDARVRPDLHALGGLRIGTLSGSQAFDLLRDAGVTPVIYEGALEPYMDLADGRVDAILMDDLIADRYGLVRPELALVGDVAEGHYAIATRREDADLLAAIDVALGKLLANGEIERIDRKSGVWNERQAGLVHVLHSEVPSEITSVPSTFSWGHVWLFLQGAGVTLLVSVLAMALAFPLGLSLAVLRTHGPRWSARLASGYVELYRGTPVLLQLYLLYFGLAQVIRISAPVAAVVGLGMNYAAYEAEAHRAGIQAVPAGQIDAARALGMSTWTAMRRVVLPQALRLALPNVTSDFIALLKDSSLVSVITVVELTKRMTITAIDVRSWLVPGVLAAAFYFAMSYPLAKWSQRLEKRRQR